MYSQFASNPAQTMVAPSRTKFRSHDTTQQHHDEEKQSITTIVPPNIMYDPRVVRGITNMKPVAMTTLVEQQQQALTQTIPRVTTSRGKPTSQQILSKREQEKQKLIAKGLIRPVQPSVAQIHNSIKVVKKRVEVPLHLYLEEQCTPITTHTLDTQTDAFIQEAPTPSYIPRKTGIDMASQVETYMIFNFDEDVTNILNVVVDKTIEQSLMEVREEEEMSAIQCHQQELHAKRTAEKLEEKQRLDVERELYMKKEQILVEARSKAKREKQLQNKLSATLFSHAYLAPLHNQIISHLTNNHYFTDIQQQSIESYVPHVIASVNTELQHVEETRNIVNDLISSSTRTILSHVATVTEERRIAEELRIQQMECERLAAEELAKRKRRIALYIHSDVVEKSPVGPIHFTGESTIAEIQDKVYTWMVENLTEPPARERLSFLWNGVPLDTSSHERVYDVGIANMSMITMRVAPEPDPVEEESEPENPETQTDQEQTTESEETETDPEDEV